MDEAAKPRPGEPKNSPPFWPVGTQTVKTAGNSEIFKKIATILLNSPVRLKADLDSGRFTVKNTSRGLFLQVNSLLAPHRFVWGSPFRHLGICISSEDRPPMIGSFSPNDRVVYTREKHSLSPGPRAKNISPSPHGEMYSYEVDKYWVVRQVKDGQLVLETRRGKQHSLPVDDSRLRKANLWERLFFANRFPSKTSDHQPDFTTGTPKVSH